MPHVTSNLRTRRRVQTSLSVTVCARDSSLDGAVIQMKSLKVRRDNEYRMRRCLVLIVFQTVAIIILISLVFLRLSMRLESETYDEELDYDDQFSGGVIDSVPSVYHLTDPPDDVLRRYYATFGEDVECMALGTLSVNASHCVCKDEWLGVQCSIPVEIAMSQSMAMQAKPRQRPRRFMFFIPPSATDEDDPLSFVRVERLMDNLKDMVEVFVFTNDTDRSSTNGSSENMEGFIDRVALLFDGQFLMVWNVNASFTRMISKAFTRLSDIRLDDLIVFVEPDFRPNKRVLHFVKLYDGQEPSDDSLPLNADMLSYAGGIHAACTVDYFLTGCDLEYETFKRNKKTAEVIQVTWTP